MQFDEAVQYLLSLGHETLAIKLGLRNTELLLEALDNPQRAYTVVQIAGTNGKGSTAAMLNSICRAAGIKTGLYTSPHLVSITERIRISGSDIAPEDFARHATTVRAVAEDLLARREIEALPTFFEHVTAIALLAFREAGVELAILETGLGGRLDSTTAAGASIVGITQIAMDHEEYLGPTLTSVASEKAAVIRPGVTAVIGKQEPEALRVLLDRCEAVGVQPSLDPGRDFAEKITLSLRGAHQIENASVAIGLAEALRLQGSLLFHGSLRGHGFTISDEQIGLGLATATHAGRLELIPPFLLDGAHNPAGAQALRDYLDEFHHGPLTLIFGAMRDKKLDQIAEILFPIPDRLILTTVQNPRSASVETLAKLARGTVIKTTSSAEAVRAAITQTPKDGLICVTGSLYLIGEIRPMILKLTEEPR